jgi:protein-disulfide isomerase
MKQLIPAVNSNDHFWGNPFARIELVEYGDYECPYCGRAYPIVKSIQQRLGDDIKFVFRNFPLRKIHQNAFSAAVATEAAGLQNRFWEMHDIVFENQKVLDDDYILLYAIRIGLNLDRFKNDMEQKLLREKVEKDFESGIRSGVNRTPTFFINGYKYEGEWGGEELYQYLRGQVTTSPISYE